jgi:hypothetical protein
MPTVFWYSKLQPGIDPTDYERWVREVDYAGAVKIGSIISYRVHRVQGGFAGMPGFDYDYVEIAEVTSMEEYLYDLEHHPAVKKIADEIGTYVRSTGSAWGRPVEA